ncbi:hypothetical protein ASG73_16280 [Janibacter sp. Soil728]|uniref:glycosyltransferase n=1 Tax=Janibacter sp. Soil728 TaxID=1736393 RepID=UPI0006F8FC4E|nr:glycosyltransferase [Janibacter sp. Soil728]KRE35491.1 hypothetical protein ASG73_16280 [Janibacter sp. Soil728]
MSKILLLSDVFPTVARPLGGTFIDERVTAHEAHGEVVERVDLRLRPTRTLRRLLLSTDRDVEDPVPGAAPFVGLRASPIGFVRLRRSTRLRPWAETLADEVEGLLGAIDHDVIHAHGMYQVGAGLVAAVLAERHAVPFAVTLHGSDVNFGMQVRPGEFAWTISQAHSVMYVSPALRARAHELGATENNDVVTGNGVDLDLFALGPRDRSPEVLFVGSLATVKGADRLPEIFRQVHAKVPAAQMTVIGVGGLDGDLRAATADLPVQFTGPRSREEVAAAMRRASVLVIPSRSEGWPTVINEALASGTPVVATDVGGVRRALAHDDWVVPAEPDPEGAVARKIVSVLGEDVDREQLRAQAGRYSWAAVTERERTALGLTS